ncbi:MAG: hypothetical protein ACI4XW_12465 [Candidatus Spyradocola sp.]
MEMSFAIRRLDDPAEKSVCVRSVLTRLPAWFGDAAAVSGYADQAAGLACIEPPTLSFHNPRFFNTCGFHIVRVSAPRSSEDAQFQMEKRMTLA